MRRSPCWMVLMVLSVAACADANPLATGRIVGACGEIIAGSYAVGFTPVVADVPARAAELTEKYGGTLVQVWTVIPGFHVDGLTTDAAEWLSKEQGVAFVESNRIVCTGGA